MIWLLWIVVVVPVVLVLALWIWEDLESFFVVVLSVVLLCVAVGWTVAFMALFLHYTQPASAPVQVEATE